MLIDRFCDIAFRVTGRHAWAVYDTTAVACSPRTTPSHWPLPMVPLHCRHPAKILLQPGDACHTRLTPDEGPEPWAK